MKSTITEMKNLLEGFHSRFEQAEERIDELEDKEIEMIQCEEQKDKRMKKNKQSLRDLWDTKHTNMYITGFPEEKGAEKIYEEIMVENFLTLMKYINIHIQRAH